MASDPLDRHSGADLSPLPREFQAVVALSDLRYEECLSDLWSGSDAVDHSRSQYGHVDSVGLLEFPLSHGVVVFHPRWEEAGG